MTVYAIQNQHRWDTQIKELVPKFDLRAAEEYGNLSFLLSPTATPFNNASIIKELKDKLSGFGNNDYLLLIGNPALIGFAVAIAADCNEGNVKLLQWSGAHNKYIPIEAFDLFYYGN